jgi:hypothetical protein
MTLGEGRLAHFPRAAPPCRARWRAIGRFVHTIPRHRATTTHRKE